MNVDELLRLLDKKEGLKLDFKREYKLNENPPAGTDRNMWSQFIKGQWDEFIKDVIALANGNVGMADQDAHLIIGVDDDLSSGGVREIYDTERLKITEQQILLKVNSACNPPIPSLTCERLMIGGKQIIVITISPSPYVHETTRILKTTKGSFDKTGVLRHCENGTIYSPRTAFVRRGEGTFPATADERRAISIDKVASTQRKSSHIEQDRMLFLEIREILKSGKVIWYVRETSFDGAFERKYLKELYEYEEFCKRPECEFIDGEMERLRLKLLETIKKFLRSIGRHTFPEKTDPEWNRIPRDPSQEPEMIAWFSQKAKSEVEFERMVEEQRNYVKMIGAELNQLADHVCDAYDKFIKNGRKKFFV